MSYEPTWSQPLVDYQQTGSFLEAATPPALGPDAGILVQLPCINQDWLPLVLGALDQLRNPSSWLPALTDAQRFEVLAQADRLRQMVGTVINVPCCNVELRLNTSCVLQSSTDGGVTWVDVSGWAANFPGCVRDAIPTPPANPVPNPTPQISCNIAGYLASEVIDVAIHKLIDGFNAELALFQIVANISNAILAQALPLSNLFVQSVYDAYAQITAANISALTTAANDPLLWSDVTCAIYNAIKLDGAVTDANYPAIVSNVCSLPYTPAIAISCVCKFVGGLGAANLRALQAVGAVDNVDCSGCESEWCFQFGLGSLQSFWNAAAPNAGTFITGHGWESQHNPGLGEELISIISDTLSPASNMVQVNLFIGSNRAFSGSSQGRTLGLYHSGVLVRSVPISNGILCPGGTKIAVPFPVTTVDQIGVYWPADGSVDGTVVLSDLQMLGEFPDPYGSSPCTH